MAAWATINQEQLSCYYSNIINKLIWSRLGSLIKRNLKIKYQCITYLFAIWGISEMHACLDLQEATAVLHVVPLSSHVPQWYCSARQTWKTALKSQWAKSFSLSQIVSMLGPRVWGTDIVFCMNSYCTTNPLSLRILGRSANHGREQGFIQAVQTIIQTEMRGVSGDRGWNITVMSWKSYSFTGTGRRVKWSPEWGLASRE